MPSNTITENLFSTSPGEIVDLFELDLSFGGAPTDTPIFRWHAGINENLHEIVWQGNKYSALPIDATGFDWSSTGTIPTPKLTVANVTSILSSMLADYNDLLGAKVTRHRTFAKYLDEYCYTEGQSLGGFCTGESNPADPSTSEDDCLDANKGGLGIWSHYDSSTCEALSPPGIWYANTEADSESYIEPEIWYIARKSSENSLFVEFELKAGHDIAGVKIPARSVLHDYCPWEYKDGINCRFQASLLGEGAHLDLYLTQTTVDTIYCPESCGDNIADWGTSIQEKPISLEYHNEEADLTVVSEDASHVLYSVPFIFSSPTMQTEYIPNISVPSDPSDEVVFEEAAAALYVLYDKVTFEFKVNGPGTVSPGPSWALLSAGAGYVASPSVSHPFLPVVELSVLLVPTTVQDTPAKWFTPTEQWGYFDTSVISTGEAKLLVELGGGDAYVNNPEDPSVYVTYYEDSLEAPTFSINTTISNFTSTPAFNIVTVPQHSILGAWDLDNVATTVENDRCAKTLPACKLRFPEGGMDFGGFPGAGLKSN
jgi:phage-related protein